MQGSIFITYIICSGHQIKSLKKLLQLTWFHWRIRKLSEALTQKLLC